MNRAKIAFKFIFMQKLAVKIHFIRKFHENRKMKIENENCLVYVSFWSLTFGSNSCYWQCSLIFDVIF